MRAAWLSLAMFVGGCTVVGPDFRPVEIESPPHWAEGHGGPVELSAPTAAELPLLVNRWEAFGDQELVHLQAVALAANQDARIAVLRLLEARVQETTVSAQNGLQVTAQGGATRERQSEFGSASRLINAIGGTNASQLRKALSAPFTLYQAGFDASWEPDLWGRVMRSEEAARADTDGQQAALRQIQLGVAAEIARTYFLLRLAQQQWRLAQDELALALEAEGLIQVQYSSGMADQSALLRQHVQVAALRAALPELRAQEARAMNQITLLSGVGVGQLNDELTRTTLNRPQAALPDLRLGLPGELARRRPDVAAAEARLHAATATIGIAVADLYPRVTLGADFGLESAGSGKFGDWGSRQWSVGPSLSLPLWDRGRRSSMIALRELQQQEAAVALQQTVLAAWHEVDSAISAYVSESLRDAQFSERVRSSEQDARLSQARYANGLTDYLRVLSAKSALIDAQRDLIDSHSRACTALTALYKSLGE